jgi:hypothetical protein
MTGYDDRAEHVLPVTVDVMTLLGHRVKTRLTKKTTLAKLLRASAKVKFTRKTQAKKLDLDHFEETPLVETFPRGKGAGRRRRTRGTTARRGAGGGRVSGSRSAARRGRKRV